MLPVRLILLAHEVPAADAYWIDHPVRSAGELLLLVSSTKSFVYGAPVLPPPPYTSVMTTLDDAASAGIAAIEAAPARTRLEETTRAPRRRCDPFMADMSRILTSG